jgi:hypothetical protein
MVTVAVQLAPTASVAGQLLVSAKPPVAETLEMDAAAGPGLVMVTVCAELWVFRLTRPKSSDEVDVLRILDHLPVETGGGMLTPSHPIGPFAA